MIIFFPNYETTLKINIQWSIRYLDRIRAGEILKLILSCDVLHKTNPTMKLIFLFLQTRGENTQHRYSLNLNNQEITKGFLFEQKAMKVMIWTAPTWCFPYQQQGLSSLRRWANPWANIQEEEELRVVLEPEKC